MTQDPTQALSELVARLPEVRAFATARVAESPMREAPFPHMHVRPVLPDWLYDLVRGCWPDESYFEQPGPGRRILDLGPGHGGWASMPEGLQRFWLTLQDEVLQAAVGPALVQRYGDRLDQSFGDLGDVYRPGDWRSLALRYERAGLMVHRPPFGLRPHVDSYRFAIIYMFYCPDDDATPDEGTDLYEAPAGLTRPRRPRTFYPDPEVAASLRVATSLPFEANSLATFLVTPRSLHGVTVKHERPRRLINCAVRLPDDLVRQIGDGATSKGG